MTADSEIPISPPLPPGKPCNATRTRSAGNTLRTFFDEDPDRGREFTLSVGDLYIDYSKHRVNRETLELLIALAEDAGLEARRDAMFTGEHINTSEDRAVLHTALRPPA